MRQYCWWPTGQCLGRWPRLWWAIFFCLASVVLVGRGAEPWMPAVCVAFAVAVLLIRNFTPWVGIVLSLFVIIVPLSPMLVAVGAAAVIFLFQLILTHHWIAPRLVRALSLRGRRVPLIADAQ